MANFFQETISRIINRSATPINQNFKNAPPPIDQYMFPNGEQIPNRLDEYVMKLFATVARYPDGDNPYYLEQYTGNNILFTVINKITEPASTVPVFQYDQNGEKVENGRMIQLLDAPNIYQSRSQFIEAALSFYYIFGESFTAFQTVENGLNAGMPVRLDILPAQWMQLIMGTYFNPVVGYTFYPMGGIQQPYPVDQVFHWKEFNPDYNMHGGHLRGMSRMRPLIKTLVGSGEAYDALIRAFKNQGAWGILTMLDENKNPMQLTKSQKSDLKRGFKRDMKQGDLTIANSHGDWQKMGLTIVELAVLGALDMFAGRICDAYNVPDIIMSSGSRSKTYLNYQEAERGLWTKAICPSLDAYLEGLTRFLAPKFKEQGHVLMADYSGIEALQVNIATMVGWMIASHSFSGNEIREAAGYERLDIPEMNEIFIPLNLTPLVQTGNPPDPALSESAMKQLGLSDYRKK